MNLQKTAISVALVMFLAATSMAGDISGTVSCTGARDCRDVVVYLPDVAGKFPPPDEHAVIDQKNLVFVPHVLPIIAGTTVDFRNDDDVLHNVFSPDKAADQFNLGSWPKGEVRSHTFTSCDSFCTPVILCNVHPEMSAFVVVVKNPYYATTDKAGNFTIHDVPAGDYKVAVWHEKLKGNGTTVTVPDTGSVAISLEMHH